MWLVQKPGSVHVDIKYLPQMPDETSHRYLFVAIDQASRWVYLELRRSKSARAAKGFLDRLVVKAPFKIRKILNDNDTATVIKGACPPQRVLLSSWPP